MRFFEEPFRIYHKFAVLTMDNLHRNILHLKLLVEHNVLLPYHNFCNLFNVEISKYNNMLRNNHASINSMIFSVGRACCADHNEDATLLGLLSTLHNANL